jgi:hypothetical protein
VEHITLAERVIIEGDPGEPEHLQVPVDGATADLQLRRKGHGVVVVTPLEQFQELQDARKADGLAQAPFGVPTLGARRSGRFPPILVILLRAVTHL